MQAVVSKLQRPHLSHSTSKKTKQNTQKPLLAPCDFRTGARHSSVEK